jgi:hypothetical protein
MKFIVRNGNKYYTGKAGQAFVSPNARDAFEYDSLEAAQRRATNLNRWLVRPHRSWATIHSTHFAVAVSRVS